MTTSTLDTGRLFVAQKYPPVGHETFRDQLVQKVALLLGAMWLSPFLFAQFDETRAWFEFLPFGLFLWDAASSRDKAKDAAKQ